MARLAISPSILEASWPSSGRHRQPGALQCSAKAFELTYTFQTYTNNATSTHTIFVGNNNTANGGTSSGSTTGSTFVIPELKFDFIKSDTTYSAINVTGMNDYSLRINSCLPASRWWITQ